MENNIYECNQNERRVNFTTNLFEEKQIIDKINYYGLFSGEISHPNYPEGQSILTIIKCKSEEMYGKYCGNVKLEVIFEDDNGNRLTQLFILKNGTNNNFGKFIYQVLGYEPEYEFSIKELEGKRIIATIAHYYNETGIGYANIVFCKCVHT